MKRTTIIIGMICLAVLFSHHAWAQDETKPELTKEQWQKEMADATAKRDVLRKEIDSLDNELSKMKERDTQLAAQITSSNKELAVLINKSSEERKEFERRLSMIEAKLTELTQMSKQNLIEHENDLDNVGSSIADAKADRLAQLQEYSERIQKQERQLGEMRTLIAGLKNSSRDVVVGTWAKDRACLWNIAKKSSVYGDPNLWAKIWQANAGKISNPDVIKPGQRLRVPKKSALTSKELSAVREYYQERSTEEPRYAQSQNPK